MSHMRRTRPAATTSPDPARPCILSELRADDLCPTCGEDGAFSAADETLLAMAATKRRLAEVLRCGGDVQGADRAHVKAYKAAITMGLALMEHPSVCTECGAACIALRAKGWPDPVRGSRLCPACYEAKGHGAAFCRAGHVLSANSAPDDCHDCANQARAES